MEKNFDDLFILVEAEWLSMGDEFMQHRPKNKREVVAKMMICEAISAKVKNFYVSKYDPALTDDHNGICFEAGRAPAVGMSYEWWINAAKSYNPERNSRLGRRLEYAAFMGVLIKKFVYAGKSLEWAWNAVCVDSRELGNYLDSENHKACEPTGSREFFGFCDLANVYKILADNDEAKSFWLAGGYSLVNGKNCPLIDLTYHSDCLEAFYSSVGWIVCS